MSLAPQTRLGRFEILELVGAGAMGEVYRARDPQLEREVAVKVLPAAVAQEPARLQRFEREARAVGRLDHPNLLTIHDVGSHQGAPYLVCELLEGQTLRQRLEAGALPLREALGYGSQIAQGLAAAHEQGVVHRDVKPANLFVTRDGRVKVLDFGLAKLVERASPTESQGPTQTAVSELGMVLGTVAYMAPEQAAGRSVDHRADQFALGVVLYEMLAGSRPFAGETAAETLTAILRHDPEPLARAAPRVPPPLRWIVERCLAKDPADRFDTTRDLARDLRSVADGLSELGVPAAEDEARPESRRSRVARGAVFVALLVAVAVGAFLAGRRGAAAPPLEYRLITHQRGTVTAARFEPGGDSV
ncbi:MAG TPA: serine/threonine-protein kinase, partial [Thermoanaerobaculia bacterium]|nr:serine/threonine-protein kinase [Thermoanaerobaculia bacterium]